MAHTCHALDCKTPVPPRLMMCGKHWGMVDKQTQAKVYELYRPGQEKDKRPTIAYLKIVRECQRQVKLKETGIDLGPFTFLDNVPERAI